MLNDISIRCPKCGVQTQIAVASRSEHEMKFSMTSCRACRAPFIALTQPNGSVQVIDRNAAADPADPGRLPVLATIVPFSHSGYRVLPPDRLDIFDLQRPRASSDDAVVGISDEELESLAIIADTHRVFWRPDGSKRAPKEVARYIGWRGVWVVQLNEALRARLAGPPPFSSPPSIFISYRWGGDVENAWVAQLARELKSRGYRVVFDRDQPKDIDVPELVSKIADCRYFVAVLDPGYLERIGRGEQNESVRDGWVFDEYNTAASLSNAERLHIVGLWRAGAELPRGFAHPTDAHMGNVVDVRRPERLTPVLDDLFPPLADRLDEAALDRAHALLRASHERALAGRFEEAIARAEELAALAPHAIDGPAQELRVALAAGLVERGYSAAKRALELAPRSRELLLAAGKLAVEGGRPSLAIEHLGLLLEMHAGKSDRYVTEAHLLIGSSLDDLDEVWPALAHLELTRRASPDNANVRNTLGYVYRRAGETALAIRHFETGLERAPQDALLLENWTAALAEAGRIGDARAALERLADVDPSRAERLRRVLEQARGPVALAPRVRGVPGGVRLRCSACDARPIVADARSALCVRCGAVHASVAGPCRCCGSMGRVHAAAPEAAFACPYCRKGTLSVAAV
jgi:tetratricopeptide (TPR) repeat protein